MKKIAFHTNGLGLRGVEVSIFDYAHFNEQLLENESVIISKANHPDSHPLAVQKFSKRFKICYYNNIEELDEIITREKIDIFYAQKAGFSDGILSARCKNVVHVVFQHFDPHGDVYAYVSEWLSKKMTNNTFPHVPLMIHLPDVQENLREKLDIPKDSIVFGRYGGLETFDINFAKKAVMKAARKNPTLYFLFMNTRNFISKPFNLIINDLRIKSVPLRLRLKILIFDLRQMLSLNKNYKNILFLEGTSDLLEKTKFINSCDAMLHARLQGESFGLACGEFSIKNKPVITYSKSPEKAHIEILGKKGIYYKNYKELLNILMTFKRDNVRNWDAYSKNFSPKVVIKKFENIFIN